MDQTTKKIGKLAMNGNFKLARIVAESIGLDKKYIEIIDLLEDSYDPQLGIVNHYIKPINANDVILLGLSGVPLQPETVTMDNVKLIPTPTNGYAFPYLPYRDILIFGKQFELMYEQSYIYLNNEYFEYFQSRLIKDIDNNYIFSKKYNYYRQMAKSLDRDMILLQTDMFGHDPFIIHKTDTDYLIYNTQLSMSSYTHSQILMLLSGYKPKYQCERNFLVGMLKYFGYK